MRRAPITGFAAGARRVVPGRADAACVACPMPPDAAQHGNLETACR